MASSADALFAPARTLRGLLSGGDRALLVLAAIHGGLLLPALFRASEGDKFERTWSNPLTWVAVGILFGLFWVQLVAFPAALLTAAPRRTPRFAETRTAVALSLLPAALLLFAYWLLRLAAGPTLGTSLLFWGWLPATAWSLFNLRRCLIDLHRDDRPPLSGTAATAATGLAGTFGIWVSLAIGLIPFVLTFAAMAVQVNLSAH